MPGRLNETWFKVEQVGTYYGQCSELCGVNHGFMPIEVEAVTKADFDKLGRRREEEVRRRRSRPRPAATRIASRDAAAAR